MLYQPSRHFQLKPLKWNADQARAAANRVFKAVDQAYSPEGFWPAHPLDRETGDDPFYLNAYFGASGVAWGLYRWRKLTGMDLINDPADILENIVTNEEWDSYPSYFFGEAADRLFIDAVKPVKKNREALDRAFLRLQGSDTNELMAGAPGALVAAAILWERGVEIELKEQISSLIENIMNSWELIPEVGVYAWRQNYGAPRIYQGAAHGAVGNIFALLRAWEHLTPNQLELIQTRGIEFLKRTALQTDRLANWPTVLPSDGTQDLLVQWCHGASGVLDLLSDHLRAGKDPEFDQLLLKAGELIWEAGGLQKGTSICHGTAGSGAALLKLYARTRDERWLERARVFAMNLIEQIDQFNAQYGQYRYSLWTGDVGAVLFLQACESGEFETPMLDVVY